MDHRLRRYTGAIKGVKITAEQAERMLQSDIACFEPEFENLVKVPLSRKHRGALMNFVKTSDRPI
jgi:GH24 family phage-related lysozyme (muramidase)